ncbi:hypothetical protein KI809_18645, partial [Geobacter pelophilus]
MGNESAKLKLIMEIDGERVVVNGLQQVDAAVDRTAQTTNKMGAATGRMAQEMEGASGRMAAATGRMTSGMGNVSVVIGDITMASGRMAASHENNMSRMAEASKRAQGGMSGFEKGLWDIQMRIMNIAMAIGVLVAAFAFTGGASMKYLGQLETATLGIATSFMTGGKYIDETTGKALQGQSALKAAQADSAQIIEQLKVANMQTIATLDQLVRAYQETLPVAMAKGFNKQQVMDFTLAMVQAAGAIGLPFEQMGEETRSILTGNINPRNSRIATVLGLRNEDIAQYEGNAQALFDFLMQKLDAYKVAGLESQKTWAGLWSNTSDIVGQAGGMAFQPIFEAVKYELVQITGQLVSIDEKTKTIKWNPEFLAGIETFRDIMAVIVREIRLVSMDIDKLGGTMTALGAVALQVGEITTRFLTIGQFGDSLAAGTEKMKEWNKRYEQKYYETAKAVWIAQEQGNTPGKPPAYDPNPGKDEAQKKINEWRKTLADLQTEVDNSTPFIDKFSQEINKVNNRFDDVIRKYPAHARELNGLRGQIVENITIQQQYKEALELGRRAQEDAAEADRRRAAGLEAMKKHYQDVWKTSDIQKETSMLNLESSGGDTEKAKLRQSYEDRIEMARRANVEIAMLGAEASQDELDQYAANNEKIIALAHAKIVALGQLDAERAENLRKSLDDMVSATADIRITTIQDPYEQQLAGIKKHYADQRKELSDHLKAQLGMNGQSEKDRFKLLSESIKRLRALEEAETSETEQAKWGMWQQSLGFYGGVLSQMGDMIDQSSRQGFEANKAFAIGATIMNTASSIMAQTAGPDGWTPAAWGRAVAVGLIGAMQVAKIASTSYGSGGSVGGVSAGSFSGGSAGAGGSVGGSIGAPTTSTRDGLSYEQLQSIANSMENASMAIG